MNNFVNYMKKINTEKYTFDKYTKSIILVAIMIISGVFGFIYETLFYFLDLGHFVKRGMTFGPWIPIYVFGGIFILLSTIKFKEKPLIVFLLSMIVCGLLEYITGYLLFTISHIRLWDYNIEILNFGNIGGFICLRSVLFFGLSGLFLMYFIFPLVKLSASKLNKTIFSIITIIPGTLMFLDIIYNYLIK